MSSQRTPVSGSLVIHDQRVVYVVTCVTLNLLVLVVIFSPINICLEHLDTQIL